MVASDVANDLVALQVPASDLPYLPLGDSDAVEAGRPVKVLGFPFGRQIEVGKRADASVVPLHAVRRGRSGGAGERRRGDEIPADGCHDQPRKQRRAHVRRGRLLVGIVKMKVARCARAREPASPSL